MNAKLDAVLLLALAVYVSPALSATDRPQIRGVCVHIIDKPDQQDELLDVAKQAGFNSVRDDARWSQVERTKGQYQIPASWDRFVDHALARGLQPLLILGYGNVIYDNGDKPRSSEAIGAYIRYATKVVRHFRGRVRYFEIWNEWDTRLGNANATVGSPEDYSRLFKQVYPALKKIAPDATFIAGAGTKQTSWITAQSKLGVIGMSDGIAVHPYVYWKDANVDGPKFYSDVLRYLYTLAQKLSGKHNIDMYVTEIGWPTHIGTWGRTEDEVASYASRTFQLSAKLPFVKGIWWYDLKDDGKEPQNKEHHFGLVRVDNTPKPAFDAIKKELPQK